MRGELSLRGMYYGCDNVDGVIEQMNQSRNVLWMRELPAS